MSATEQPESITEATDLALERLDDVDFSDMGEATNADPVPEVEETNTEVEQPAEEADELEAEINKLEKEYHEREEQFSAQEQLQEQQEQRRVEPQQSLQVERPLDPQQAPGLDLDMLTDTERTLFERLNAVTTQMEQQQQFFN